MVVEFGFVAARILHDRETERQREGGTGGQRDGEMGGRLTLHLSVPPSLCPPVPPSLCPYFCERVDCICLINSFAIFGAAPLPSNAVTLPLATSLLLGR